MNDAIRYFIVMWPEKTVSGQGLPEPKVITVFGTDSLLKKMEELGRGTKISIYQGEPLLDWS
jgi:hypothetical protein